MNMLRKPMKPLCLVLVTVALLAGCGGGQSDLMTYIDEVKARPGSRIEPLPQIKPYETFAYGAADLRSPFMPDRPGGRAGASAGPRPDQQRPKEYLEQFPLDTLRMVGTLASGSAIYGLVQTRDGLVHRVSTGNFIGQNDGRVVEIGQAEIKVEELVPDGVGSFYRRSGD